MVLSKGLVAVTGVSGYIGSWCVKCLVENGYQARGTVRSLSNSEKVKHLENMKETVQLFEADLLSEGSFDACFTGCSAVFHVASPVMFVADDPQKQLVDPAVNGTLNVLKSCKNVGVKRVVLTSSLAAIVPPGISTPPGTISPNHVWSEKDWNTYSTLETVPYWLSKYLAEKAAWEFCEKNDITLTVICPTLVCGRPLSRRLDSFSVDLILMLLKGAFIEEGAPNVACSVVHVRNVAEAHVFALGNKQAENERFLVGDKNSLSYIDMIHHLRLDQRFSKKLMASKFAAPMTYYPRYDNSKAVKILGLKLIAPAIAIIEMGQFLSEIGSLEVPVDEDDYKGLAFE